MKRLRLVLLPMLGAVLLIAGACHHHYSSGGGSQQVQPGQAPPPMPPSHPMTYSAVCLADKVLNASRSITPDAVCLTDGGHLRILADSLLTAQASTDERVLQCASQHNSRGLVEVRCIATGAGNATVVLVIGGEVPFEWRLPVRVPRASS